MRRIQVVLAALAIVVTSLAAFSGPAMAQNLDYNDYPPFYSPFYNDDYADNDYPPFYNDDYADNDYPSFYNDDYADNDYPSFYNDDYADNDYPSFYNDDYGYEYYDEEVLEDVQEAQAEYLEDLADIYEGYSYW